MIKWLLKIFYPTGKDVPVYTDLAVLAVLTMIGLAIWQVIILKQQLDLNNFGLGIAGPLGGHAAGAWADGQGKP